jgi:hypothetical protein
MSFLRRLLGAGDDERRGGPSPHEALLVASEATFEAHADRHRVTVWLRLRSNDLEDAREQRRIFGLENALMRALDASGVGEHDTNSLESGYLAVRLIGDDADAVVAVVGPLLSEADPGSYLAVRRGPAGSPEERVDIGRGGGA